MINAASPSSLASSPTPNVASQLGQWLETYSEIAAILPVLGGLFVTSRLQLRGAQALLVNLAIAALVRQIVVQLKQQAHPLPPTAAATAENSVTPLAEDNHPEDYKIVHSVPGRIRLRVPRLIGDALYTKRLEKLLRAEPRVIQVRVNRAAASLAIQYDGAGMSELELGLYLLNILDRAQQPGESAAAAADTVS